MASPTTQPLAVLDYELTDETAVAVSLALFELQSRHVKKLVAVQSGMHPLAVMLLTAGTLAFALVLGATVAWDFFPTPYLLALGCIVELLLLFKAALYYWPPFTRWYIRRRALREFRKLPDRKVRWTFFEDRLETAWAATQRTIPWTELVKIDIAAGIWVLTLTSRLQLMAPATVVSGDIQSLLRRKAVEVGAVVEEN